MDDFKGNRLWTEHRPVPDNLAHIDWSEIQVTDAVETRTFDANSLIVAFAEGLAVKLVPMPGLVSVCSGEPSAIYRTREAEIALTGEEMFRLVFRSLSPDEFGKICDAVGATYELNYEFYDPRTGVSHESRDKDLGIGHGGPN